MQQVALCQYDPHRRSHSFNNQFFKVVKLIAFILFTACMQVSAKGLAQTITLSKKDVTLLDVFMEIRKQAAFDFLYRPSMLKDEKRITINVKNATVQEVLDICFKQQPGYDYKIIDKTIVILPTTNPTTAHAPPPPPLANKDVHGKITNQKDEPIGGANITEKGTKNGTATNASGEFVLTNVADNATLVISSIGYQTREIKVTGITEVNLQLIVLVGELDSVTILSTGYGTVSPERVTGSFTKISNTLVNRSVSTNILDRLNGVASSLLFHQGTSDLKFSVRGRSTIFANTSPLIVLNNFPYDGDLSTINPNDIEDITILKDAGAASIWGVRAGNGVVVITTKKGNYGRPLQVSFNSNINIGEKPDLYGRPDMTPSEIIDVEQFLFDKGAYNGTINTKFAAISPVVEILYKKSLGQISEAEATSQINQLRNLNNKNDLLKYYYRTQVNQQHAFNLNGGTQFNKYFLSFGYDKNLGPTVNNKYDRITINASNTYSMLNNKLELSTGINFASSVTRSNAENYEMAARPYRMYVDENGNALTINKYRQAWLDTAGNGKLLDWSWKPYEEWQRSNAKAVLTNYLLNAGIRYQIIPSLSANVLYQYSKGMTEGSTLYGENSFYTRDYINQFSQVNYTTGNVTRPVPLGAIRDVSSLTYRSHNIRGQLNFIKNLNNTHFISAIAGMEMKDYQAERNTFRSYGFVKDIGTIIPVSYQTFFPTIFTGSTNQIRDISSYYEAADRYISYYTNISYSYRNRYNFTASARKDESNLFGVKANQKGVPLWSVGASWTISNEKFYGKTAEWLPELRLRVTNGYNGNVDKSVSAFTTAKTAPNNPFLAPTANIINPPNPSLEWERINMTNFGLDFSLFRGVINGTFEYYLKNGENIIGNSPLTPSTGVTEFRGNSADIKGSGYDITLNINAFKNRDFSWATTLLFSHNTDEITTLKVKSLPLQIREGYSTSAIFSYRWAGLDNAGDPMGYVNSAPSKSWSTIVSTDTIGKSTAYHGAGLPTYFGNLINTFSWRGLSISFNIVYKGGYYFRAKSINYTEITQSPAMLGHKDFASRWQKPGDEHTTHIPALTYPINVSRDNFYSNSEILVEKGGLIRLQDIRVSYEVSKKSTPKLPLKAATLFLYARNLGLLWKANNKNIDPEYADIPAQKTIAVGLKLDL